MPFDPTSWGSGGGGGASLPSQWTTDAHGGLTITDDDATGGSTALALSTPVGSGGALLVALNDAGANAIQIDAEGTYNFRSGQGSILVDFSAQDGTRALRVSGSVPKVETAGYFHFAQKTAPADSVLAASQCLFWFDDTDGAGKLMVKAKTADGTVVTGSLALV